MLSLLSLPGDAASEVSPVKGNAATALFHLCQEAKGREALLAERDPLHALLAIIATPLSEPSLTTAALYVLAQLADAREGRARLIDSDALLSLRPLLWPPMPENIIEGALLVLSASAASLEACALLRSSREVEMALATKAAPKESTSSRAALEAVPSLLGHGKPTSLRRAAARLVAAAAAVDRENARLLVALGCPSMLLHLMEDPSSGSQSSRTSLRVCATDPHQHTLGLTAQPAKPRAKFQ